MHTSSIIGISAGILMVAIAGINVWIMLEYSLTTRDRIGHARLLRIHRFLGYVFVSLYTVMFFYMSSRVLGSTDGLPISIVVHITLALFLAPLTLLKIVIARSYKSHSALLLPLGLAIFMLSFLLVAIGAFPELLSALATGNLSVIIAIVCIATVVIASGTLFLRPARRMAQTAAANVDTGVSTGPLREIGSDLRTKTSTSYTLLLSEIEVQTHDTKTLRFIVPQGRKLAARPGQFMSFHWMIDGEPVTRCYTISSSPLQTKFLEITPKKADKGHVSVYLNELAECGLAVEASGPFGEFYFDEAQHKDIVLIAGGSGITPMISMLRYIDELNLKTNVTLLYFVRTPKDIIFAGELQRLLRYIDNFKCLVVVDKPDENWRRPVGHINAELLRYNVDNLESSTFFLCGPPKMMESARTILNSLDVPDERILQESFGSNSVGRTVEVASAAEGMIEFARSRKQCRVMGGKSLLETAEANGINIPSSCRQGKCATCATRLLRGNVNINRDDSLQIRLKESGYILPCVTTAHESILLDA
jgi:3-phenylpropionate/trans-cinnamate dioxygenase ferredoxin reductase subunit